MGRNVVVQGNVIENIYRLGIYVDNSENVTVDGNFMYCVSKPTSLALGLSAENYSSFNWTNILRNITFSNNISSGCKGFASWKATNTPPTNIRIVNNTLVNTRSDYGGLALYSIAGQSFYIADNIWSGKVWIQSNMGITRLNDVMQSAVSFAGGPVSDPTGFRLAADVPGVDTGLTLDFGGNARSLPMSVGAWEYDGLPVTSSVTPTRTRTPTPVITPNTVTPTPIITDVCILVRYAYGQAMADVIACP
jgi:hypothetical protein